LDRLKCIRTFTQIAKSLSLATAAKELQISRSLVSYHLQQLEDHLGVRLMNRTTRQLVLTTIGEEYLALCEKALQGFDAADAHISEMQVAISGHIKIMASIAFATIQLTPVIIAFNKLYPDVTVSLILSIGPFSPKDFIENGYDVGISINSMRDTGIISTKVGEVTWGACATKAYLSSHDPIRSPSDFTNQVCLVHRSHTPDSVWRFMGPHGLSEIPVKGPLFTNSFLVLKAAVLANIGIAMFPLYSIAGDIESGALVRVLTTYDSVTRPVFLVYPQSAHLPKRTRVFIDFLRQELKNRLNSKNKLEE
jgi:DNA-binding transcriptional LysR family regulator